MNCRKYVAHTSKNEVQFKGEGVTMERVGAQELQDLQREYLGTCHVKFHLGACDLIRSHQGDFRTRVKTNLEAVRNLLPNTGINLVQYSATKRVQR